MDHSSLRPSLALRRLVNGFQVTQAVRVAAVLGIADLLTDGPRSSDDLAAVTGSHPGALYRLLRALAGVGVFSEEADRRFALTELGARRWQVAQTAHIIADAFVASVQAVEDAPEAAS